jgi:hypothetical protein
VESGRQVSARSVGETHAPLAVGAALGLAAVILRLPRAFSSSFWQDEVASARIIREPSFLGMLRHVARTESTPPIWYALGWLTHRLGVPIHDVRLLSVAFDGVLVLLVVVLAARLVPVQLAALAGALVAVGGQFAAHGRELRAYELFALLAVVFAFALSAAASKPSPARLATLAAVTAAGALTHYFFLFTDAAGLAWLSFEPTARAARVRASCAIAFGLVVWLTWLPQFVTQYRQQRYSWIGPFRVRTVLETPLRLFTPLLSGQRTVLAATAALVVLAFGAVLQRRTPDARLCAVLAIGPLALAALTWRAGPRVYATRNMIGIGPFLAIALVSALAKLPRPAATLAALAIGSSAVGAYAWHQVRPGSSYAAIAHALVAEGWRPHDAVAVFGSFDAYRSPLEWYLPHAPTFTRASSAMRLRPFVFVVGGERRLHTTHGALRRQIGELVVTRLRIDGPIRDDRRLRGATVLSPVPLTPRRS